MEVSVLKNGQANQLIIWFIYIKTFANGFIGRIIFSNLAIKIQSSGKQIVCFLALRVCSMVKAM